MEKEFIVEKKMSWNSIKKNFPDQWVALTHFEQKGVVAMEGFVIAHHPNRKEFHKIIGKLLPSYGNIAIRYTGTLVKNPEIPLLWQISPTV